MPKANKIAVCVDSSIFLAEVFGNESQSSRSGAIDEFQKMFSFDKCMSKTVQCEVECRVTKVTSFVGQTSKIFITKFCSFKAEKQTIELSDLSFIRSFFSDLKTKYSARSTEFEIINNMEVVLVRFLTKNYRNQKPRGTDDFVLDTMVGFNKILSGIKYNFYTKLGEYEIFSGPINSSTCKQLQNEHKLKRTVKKKPKDIEILCEVEAYQQTSGKTCMLATVDSTDFLNNASIIESLIGIKCVDPIYLPNELENK